MNIKPILGYRNTVSAFGQLIITIISLLIVWFSYVTTDQGDNKILLSIFFLFAATFIGDKLGRIFSGISLDKDAIDIERLQNDIPRLLVSSHDIITFTSRVAGLRYAIYNLETAIHVKNTVLRYGSHASATPSRMEYSELLNSKKRSLLERDCVWTEIISTHLNEDDPVMKLINETKDASRYKIMYIDDKKIPMIQMFIYEFADKPKEIIFGWEFPGFEQGASFATRNVGVIDFFEKYFEHYKGLSTTSRQQSQFVSAGASDRSNASA